MELVNDNIITKTADVKRLYAPLAICIIIPFVISSFSRRHFVERVVLCHAIKHIQLMKNLTLIIPCLLLAMAGSCTKIPNNANSQKIISIPNGDFEQWNSWPALINWKTNSCPLCMAPYNQYVVVKDSLAYHGKYAAKFIFNGLHKSRAQNKFAIATHPTLLTGYIHSKITPKDTVKISIDIFYNKQVVDSGKLYKTSSTTNYKEFEMPITNNSLKADSAEITITGGGKLNTELIIDYLTLIKK